METGFVKEGGIISLLRAIGLTEYESKVYVALINLGEARAKEVSDVTSIAYPKIYSVLAELKKKGFVEERLERPRSFTAIDPVRAVWNFIEERIAELRGAGEQAVKMLSAVYGASSLKEGKSFIVEGRRSVLAKLRELLSQAKIEILISAPDLEAIGVKALLLDLNAARKSGVNVRVLTSTKSKHIEDIMEVSEVRVKDGLESYYAITDVGSLLISGKPDRPKGIFIADEMGAKPTREHFNYIWLEAVPASLHLGTAQSKRGIIILAGGMSKRMGRDKTFLTVKGVPMIKRVANSALSVSHEVIIVVGGKRVLKKLSNVVGGEVTIAEDEEKGWGPLMGILSGCRKSRAEYVAVIPCDAPFINPRVLMELFKRAEGHDAAIPRWPNGYIEPLHSVYRREVIIGVADELLKKGSRSMIHMVNMLKDVVFVPVEELKLIDYNLLTFFNVNTPRDLLIAETMESP
ncbi:MAG: NTP transferase domain-containing protein [Candidatus Nezhaarchaeota archaeon]|nr:NTP transferase domain-containing protein [Candidatus Nezhaarchaeota archaeon]